MAEGNIVEVMNNLEKFRGILGILLFFIIPRYLQNVSLTLLICSHEKFRFRKYFVLVMTTYI